MQNYPKQILSIKQQVQSLKDAGMSIPSDEEAAKYPQKVGIITICLHILKMIEPVTPLQHVQKIGLSWDSLNLFGNPFSNHSYLLQISIIFATGVSR